MTSEMIEKQKKLQKQIDNDIISLDISFSRFMLKLLTSYEPKTPYDTKNLNIMMDGFAEHSKDCPFDMNIEKSKAALEVFCTYLMTSCFCEGVKISIFDYLIPRLKAYVEQTDTHPINIPGTEESLTMEEYRRIINSIIKEFEEYTHGWHVTVDTVEAIENFKKYYNSLWI